MRAAWVLRGESSMKSISSAFRPVWRMASRKISCPGFISFIVLEMKILSKKSERPMPTRLKSSAHILIIMGLLLLSMNILYPLSFNERR